MIPVVILIDINRHNDYCTNFTTLPKEFIVIRTSVYALGAKSIIKHFAVLYILFINS